MTFVKMDSGIRGVKKWILEDAFLDINFVNIKKNFNFSVNFSFCMTQHALPALRI